jgi:hypothetical protein
MPTEQHLDISATSTRYRFEVRHRLAAAHDRVVLTAVLDTVE